jgi:heme-degrading monooxygenase HmoA
VDLLSKSPVVETAIFHLKDKVSADKWWEQQHAVEKLLDKAEGCRGYSSGFVKESESTFVALVGWDSVEAHQQWAEKEKEEKHSPLHRYRELTKHIEMVHVDMRGNW